MGNKKQFTIAGAIEKTGKVFRVERLDGKVFEGKIEQDSKSRFVVRKIGTGKVGHPAIITTDGVKSIVLA